MHYRLIMKLKDNNYECKHIKGVENVVADYLSRYNQIEGTSMDIVMEENQGYSSNDDSDYIENDKIDNRKKDTIQHNNDSQYIKRKDKMDINNISNNMDQQQIYLLQDINYLNEKIYHQKLLSSNLSHIKDSFGESDVVWKEDIGML